MELNLIYSDFAYASFDQTDVVRWLCRRYSIGSLARYQQTRRNS
jgi:hypothetical protein